MCTKPCILMQTYIVFNLFFCPYVFDFSFNCKSHCLDSDKMWATTTVVWYYIVAHCGLSGHLWHCKYVKHVGVWSASLLPFFSSFFIIPFILCEFLSGTQLWGGQKTKQTLSSLHSPWLYGCVFPCSVSEPLWRWLLMSASLLMWSFMCIVPLYVH